MTEYTGSVLKLNEKTAVVMTDTCDFVNIPRQPDMFIGQQIKYRKRNLTGNKKALTKYLTLIASVFVIALCSILYFQFFNPDKVFAYVDVDINPSLEMAIDENSKVLAIKPLNKDAKTLLKELKINNLPLKEALSQVISASVKLGFINDSKNNAVLISASVSKVNDIQLNTPDKKVSDEILNNLLSDIGNTDFSASADSIKPEIIIVTPESRKAAVENKISMGRYELYSKLKEKNKDITVEKAKSERLADMLDKASKIGTGKNKSVKFKPGSTIFGDNANNPPDDKKSSKYRDKTIENHNNKPIDKKAETGADITSDKNGAKNYPADRYSNYKNGLGSKPGDKANSKENASRDADDKDIWNNNMRDSGDNYKKWTDDRVNKGSKNNSDNKSKSNDKSNSKNKNSRDYSKSHSEKDKNH